MCKVCGQPSGRDMCPNCEGHINQVAEYAEHGILSNVIDLDSPINYMPVSKEDN